jgi:hypothetical protein
VDDVVGARGGRTADRHAGPGIRLSRSAEPVIWALVDSVAGQLGQPPPADVRIVLRGDAATIGHGGGLHGRSRRTLVLPLAYASGLSCAELRVVIARELGRPPAGGASDRVGRGMVGLERRRSVMLDAVRPCARAFFGLTRRLADRRAAAADAVAAGLYGADRLASTVRRTESLDVGFDWFWTVEVQPILDRGWRPPVGAGFRVFVDAPLVAARLPDLHTDEPVGDLLSGADIVEAGLIGLENGRPLAARDWQEAAVAVVLTVWDGHVRRQRAARDGLRVSEVGRAVAVAVDTFADDQVRLQAELSAIGAALALALTRDGWRVGKLPGRAPTLSKDGVDLRPHEEIARLWGGALTPAGWIDRCERLGIGDLWLAGRPIGAARSLAPMARVGARAS